MSDLWVLLRDSVSVTEIGSDFTNDLLSNPPETPPELGIRNIAGGTLEFSDSPEIIDSIRIWLMKKQKQLT